MKTLLRLGLLFLCLLVAIACYVFGIPRGGAVFLLLGLVLEGAFWAGLFDRRSPRRDGGAEGGSGCGRG